MKHLTPIQLRALTLSNEILEIIDLADQVPRGDLQGMTEALAMRMIAEVRAEVSAEYLAKVGGEL